MTFQDYFSAQAAAYAAYRPGYPTRLFALLADAAPGRRVAWDVGTGSGQVAVGLAKRFGLVLATDPSRAQLRHATRARNVRYVASRAEDQVLRRASVDLVTAGQALHWIALDRFYATSRSVLRPGGVIAVWTYDVARVTPAVDRVVDRLYGDVLRGFWAPQRRIVDERYRTIAFPFDEFRVPTLSMETHWSLERFVGYLRTWSAVRTYRATTGGDPVTSVWDDLAGAWGDSRTERRVRWPLTVRAGRVSA